MGRPRTTRRDVPHAGGPHHPKVLVPPGTSGRFLLVVDPAIVCQAVAADAVRRSGRRGGRACSLRLRWPGPALHSRGSTLQQRHHVGTRRRSVQGRGHFGLCSEGEGRSATSRSRTRSCSDALQWRESMNRTALYRVSAMVVAIAFAGVSASPAGRTGADRDGPGESRAGHDAGHDRPGGHRDAWKYRRRPGRDSHHRESSVCAQRGSPPGRHCRVAGSGRRRRPPLRT